MLVRCWNFHPTMIEIFLLTRKIKPKENQTRELNERISGTSIEKFPATIFSFAFRFRHRFDNDLPSLRSEIMIVHIWLWIIWWLLNSLRRWHSSCCKAARKKVFFLTTKFEMELFEQFKKNRVRSKRQVRAVRVLAVRVCYQFWEQFES